MTEEERKIHEDRHHHQLNDSHEFRLQQTAFMGALLRYCWHLGKREMSELDHPREQVKNAYLVTIFAIILIIAILIVVFYVS